MATARHAPDFGKFMRLPWCLPTLRLTPEASLEFDLMLRTFVPAAGLQLREQRAPVVYGGAATLAPADLFGRLVQYIGPAASLTMPTGAVLDAALPSNTVADRAFDFTLINAGSGTATLALPAGLAPVGPMTVPIATSGTFRVRKTAAGAFTVYRL